MPMKGMMSLDSGKAIMAETCNWQTCYTQIDDAIVALSADAAAAAELEEMQAPNLLRVQYILSSHDDDGFPHEREAAVLDELRRELQDWIGALGGRMVGETTGAGQHSWFFYVPCGWLEVANLIHRIGLRVNVALGAEMLPDATHRIYHEHLLPTEEELRRTRIAERLAELAARGDDARQPRPVTHVVRFDNRVQAFSCADWARRNGYVVESLLPPSAAQEGYHLSFHRLMTPQAAALDADIAAITETVRRLGGDYLDWRTEPRVTQTA